MDRRKFLRGTGICSMALASGGMSCDSPGQEKSTPIPRKALMNVGTQHGSGDDVLRVLAAFGVNHICAVLPSTRMDEGWSLENLLKLRERVESFGLSLDMLPLPLSSNYITRAENPDILLGRDPAREREIDDICQMIRNAARAGIPALKYNLSILGVVRTGSTRGRGGANYSTFTYSKADQSALTEAGPVDADLYWERITFFLKRVIPVAEEYKVRMACHPHDPGMPPEKGYRGVQTVLGSIDGLKRFIEIMPSRYHGLNFCQGTVAEMLRDPAKEIHEVIRYFGSRKKIFNVHFRNIKGGYLDFQETFIDDGDVDMLQALRVYREVGYDGMIMPDHVPRIQGDTQSLQAFAFSLGYIKALIAAVAMGTSHTSTLAGQPII